MSSPRVLVTGGAGFIGSHLVRYLLEDPGRVERVVVLDKLTYAGRRENLAGLEEGERFRFVKGDICDGDLVRRLLGEEGINRVMHLAAESHVDRSIASAGEFVHTNVVGTQRMLEASLEHCDRASNFRFLHVSTDEVYGSLPTRESTPFTEASRYAPNSPYAASKAASDHLVRAWHRTHGLPVITTNGSNTYGPCQHEEKFIPKLIRHLGTGKKFPLYGDGSNVRDWIWVGDLCRALFLAMEQGRVGESYNIGARCERSNREIADRILAEIVARRPDRVPGDPGALIELVEDRPGHDWRYAVDAGKLRRETGWEPQVEFGEGLQKTLDWYLS